MAAQDGPHARRREPHAHGGELAVDAPVAPARVFPRKSEDQADGAGRHSRTTRCAMGRGPASSHQIPVPTEQRLGLHEEPPSPNGREETAQAREHGPIRWPEGRACDLAAQHRDLVTEDDDLDRQLLLLAKGETDQLEEANERHVEERESHDSIFTVRTTPTKVQFDGLDDVFGTDRFLPGRLDQIRSDAPERQLHQATGTSQ